ncbi:hypothetical protein [Silvimonas amylolytica]|uniref:Uncharacterized protein n=1 Tax=Silvimonas amylolytica TaxID=449663 RepID=A0ABQ2PL69_9NEIS|nr:hypothetical protein [Silvimonas amylolytica]GGP26071.1 hypothetical protein GCM10010971_18900 [Silvimonas amylolytica]
MGKPDSRHRARHILLWLGIAAWAGISVAVLVKGEVKNLVPGGWCRSIK